jgi:hypothetical protein
MEKRKRKNPYEAADVELILFEFSDIVTTSGGAQGTGSDNPPSQDNWDEWI